MKKGDDERGHYSGNFAKTANEQTDNVQLVTWNASYNGTA